jgi:hypothetical protein
MGGGFATVVLALAAVFGVATAWAAAMAPARFAGRLGLTIANAGGLNEIRAQYAGVFLAIGLLCAAALAGLAPRQAALIVLMVTFGGLIAGRLASLAINRGVNGFGPTILALYAIDLTGFALAAIALAMDG